MKQHGSILALMAMSALAGGMKSRTLRRGRAPALPRQLTTREKQAKNRASRAKKKKKGKR